jgi:hypothetical protein
MTAVTKRRPQLQQMGYAVRCPGSDEVMGYLVVGDTNDCLGQALTQNGFWLVPLAPKPTTTVRIAPAPAAA